MEQKRKLSTSLTDNKFGGWGWSMIIYSLLMYLFMSAISCDLQNLIPEAFAGRYGMDPNTLLAYATPTSIIGIVGGFIFGRLLIKNSTKKISGIGCILTGILFAVFAFSSTPAMYFILLAAVMFVSASMQFSAPTLMADWFPKKKGIALGWATIGAPLSSAFIVSGFALLLGGIGFTGAFIVVGVILVILGIVTFFWVKDTPEEVGYYPDNMDPEVAEKLSHQAGQEQMVEDDHMTIGQILKNGNTWLIGIGYGLLWMVTLAIISQFIPRMMSVGYTQPEALTLMTVSSIIAIPGSYFWGWLDGKIGTKLASAVYSISYIIALLILIFAQNGALVWIGCIFIGLGLGGILNLIPSMEITAFGPNGFKQANSIVMTIASFIRILGFAVVAFLLTLSGGSFTLPYIVFIVVDIVGAIVILLVKKRKNA